MSIHQGGPLLIVFINFGKVCFTLEINLDLSFHFPIGAFSHINIHLLTPNKTLQC